MGVIHAKDIEKVENFNHIKNIIEMSLDMDENWGNDTKAYNATFMLLTDKHLEITIK